MLSLHDATDLTKRFLLWAVIGIIGITLLTMTINFIKGMIQTPPPPPTMCYGPLPTPAFPQNKFSTKNFNYTISTLNGDLPGFSDRAVVPTISQITPSLFGLQNASQSANQLGFTSPAYALSDTKYEWFKYVQPLKTLTMDIITNDFTVASHYFTDPIVQAAQGLPDEQSAISKAQGYLSNMLSNTSGFPNDIDMDKTLVTYYNINSTDTALIPSQNKVLAQILRIDFFQKDIASCYNDGNGNSASCTIFYPNYPHSPIDVYIGAGQENDSDQADGQIVQADYFHRDIDKPSCPNSTDTPTYPLISTQAAFEELKNGNGYIASDTNTGTNVAIRDVKLGYYLGTDNAQSYLFPVYVFTDDNGFSAYVPATLNVLPPQK